MTHIRYLLATSDNEIGEIGPSPKGCGENRALLRCRPSLGMAKAFVLRLVRHDFRSQRRHSYMSIRPSARRGSETWHPLGTKGEGADMEWISKDARPSSLQDMHCP